MPEGIPNLHYEVTKTLGGTYIYTPVEKRSVKPSSLQAYNMELSNYARIKGQTMVVRWVIARSDGRGGAPYSGKKS